MRTARPDVPPLGERDAVERWSEAQGRAMWSRGTSYPRRPRTVKRPPNLPR